jgi:type VI secretion system protein ImpG
MNPRQLEYYNRELTYLRELGAEFSKQYPKVAGRLSMQGIDVADPYVERLLEGFAFLAARIQLKYDAEFPRFSQRLLEVVYPNYLAPTPSMCVVNLKPNDDKTHLTDGFTLPRGSVMRSRVPKDERTACEFRTAHDVTLWPIDLMNARLTGAPPDLPLDRMPLHDTVKAAVRLRFKFTVAPQPGENELDQLLLYMNGSDEVVSHLYERIFAHGIGFVVSDPARPNTHLQYISKDAIKPFGFDEDEALLPYQARGFQGYRLLHEYFAFAARFWFFSLEGLKESLNQLQGNEFEITILLNKDCADLEPVIDTSYFSLNCVPTINLSERRADRIPINGTQHEFHLVVDRGHPLDYEVYGVSDINGYSADNSLITRFAPFYETSANDKHDGYGAYYSIRREPRMPSQQASRNGSRTSYIGSEIYLSLVDQSEVPYKSDLRQLAVTTLVTNRDLPLLMPLNGDTDFTFVASVPIGATKVFRGPSRPSPTSAEREITWRLISHLGLNYQTLTDLDSSQGAQTLRKLLDLYSTLGEPKLKKQVEGIRSSSLQAITRRLPVSGPLIYGRGVGINLVVDESQFSGMSPFLLGTILEQFFARHVSLNSFIELTLESTSRGKIHTWPPRFGTRPVA